MAISVTQQPVDYTPVYNNQIFVALSNQIAQPNFVYTVIVTDLISTENKTYQIPQRPDGYMVFDASVFAKSFYTNHNYIPMNEYGWKKANGIRKIRVNIGETYGSTPVYSAGSNIDYITWNSKVDWLEWPDYDRDDYRYDNPSNIVYLSSRATDDTFEDRSRYMYALTNANLDVDAITIKTYQENGTIINTTNILNPWTASTTYTDKFICIDIGHKGLTNIPYSSGTITGNYPILTSDCFYYEVYDRFISGFGGGGSPIYTSTLLKTIYVKGECKHDVYTVHFLANGGQFETINFSKRSDTDFNVNRTYVGQLPYRFDTGAYTYSRSAAVSKLISSERTERLRLNTDWLTVDQVECYAEIIDSPVIYLDMGSTLDYPQLTLIPNSYKLNKSWNENLYQLSMEFEYAHTNHRL